VPVLACRWRPWLRQRPCVPVGLLVVAFLVFALATAIALCTSILLACRVLLA
jgi:hypothetical protein